MNRYTTTYFIFLLSICVLVNCDSHKPVENTPTTDPYASTKVMIDKVKYAVSRIDITNVPYVLNNLKANRLQKQVEATRGVEQISYLFSYGLELLNSGKTEAAIDVLLQVLAAVNKENIQNSENLDYITKRQLAIAYVRKAEQDNCLINHNDESCIIPISPKAQHTLRSGAESAIQILNDLLAKNPSDYECQYLLNIAHMTLGQYPDGVPEKFRIPKSYFASSAKFPQFKDIASQVGVDSNQMAGGTCVDDFNNDGYLDIIASSWGFGDQIHYYENDRKGGFIDKTDAALLTGVTGGLNLRHADFDNDGHLDFIILRGAWLGDMGKIPNSLMRNNGDGTFSDVTLAARVYSPYPTQTAVWADFDLDGWLDLFVANESDDISKNVNQLYINNGDGTFSDQAQIAGITALGYYKGAAVGDLNNDHYPDLYLSDYLGENKLFINQGTNKGHVSFQQIAKTAGVSNPDNSFPTWIFDYNNDGLLDIFVSSYATTEQGPAYQMMDNIKTQTNVNHPLLYQNNGDGTFTDISLDAQLTEPLATMGCNFGDLDNDGFLDFYLATGDPEYFSIVPNRMYRNVNGKSFEDVTYSAGFGHIQKGHAIGFGDLDMDGDQDIYAVMGGAFEGDVFRNLLFENPIGNQNHWINIQVQGTTSNRSAIGALLTLTINENGQIRKIYHTIGTGASFGGNSLMAEIGLGQATSIESLTIQWPNADKSTSTYSNIPSHQTIRIVEGQKTIETLSLPAIPFRKAAMHHH